MTVVWVAKPSTPALSTVLPLRASPVTLRLYVVSVLAMVVAKVRTPLGPAEMRPAVAPSFRVREGSVPPGPGETINGALALRVR
jgi:hypothetical protein